MLSTMKHLKSSLQDLRELFERSITVREIAEPLISFDSDQSAVRVRLFMEERDYDVIGVRQDGLIGGYARRDDLSDGKLGDHKVPFKKKDLMMDTDPLLKVFKRLRNSPRAFLLVFGKVSGIVTRGDLQKTPVRMWLFGLVYLVEMQILRVIRKYYPSDTWKPLVSTRRLAKAETLLADRQRRNEAIDMADSLQFADKRDIVLKTNELRRLIGFESKKSGERILRALENLRNKLAHAQDIITGNWPEIVDLAESAEEIVRKCEVAVAKRGSAA